jgi:hypothetical protein
MKFIYKFKFRDYGFFGHPEVVLFETLYYELDIGFLILLYAGITYSIFYIQKWFNYPIRSFIFTNMVTILNLGQSAGNNSLLIGPSETICKNIEGSDPSIEVSNNNTFLDKLAQSEVNNSENIKLISNHVPTHTKPLTDEDFGHYLAGLIDGDGSFGKRSMVIAFNYLDASLAYYIKRRLNYGSVKKVKNKNAVVFVIHHREGLEKIINLVNGKLRIPYKNDDIEKQILNVYKTPLEIKEKLHINTSSDLNNYWLAGFIDADGSFQIKILNRVNSKGNTSIEIRLYLQIDQKTRLLLDLIKDKLGGNIGYRKSQDTYYYNSTSFGSAKKAIKYLDRYHMLSSKYLNYLKWRKAYILVQSKKHLTPEGTDKIFKLKISMNSYSKETLDTVLDSM